MRNKILIASFFIAITAIVYSNITSVVHHDNCYPRHSLRCMGVKDGVRQLVCKLPAWCGIDQ